MGRMTYRAGLVVDTIVVWLKRAGERGGSAGVVAKLVRSRQDWWLAESQVNYDILAYFLGNIFRLFFDYG